MKNKEWLLEELFANSGCDADQDSWADGWDQAMSFAWSLVYEVEETRRLSMDFKLEMHKILEENVEYYRSDFLYDLEYMEDSPGPVLWFLRKSGTHAIAVSELRGGGLSMADKYLEFSLDWYLVDPINETIERLTMDTIRKFLSSAEKQEEI